MSRLRDTHEQSPRGSCRPAAPFALAIRAFALGGSRSGRSPAGRHPRVGLWLCITAVIACFAAWGSGPRAQAPPPAAPAADYFDVSADRSELKKINGETVLELNDNVRIVHGDVTVNANRGISFTIQRLTRLFGNVRVAQQTMVMTGEEGEYFQNDDLAVLRRNVHIVDRGWEVDCDEVRYSRLTGEAWLLGNVFARDSTTTMRADRVLYQRLINRAEAFGNVEMINLEQDLVQYGRHGVYYRDRGEGVVDEDPRLVSGAADEEPVTVVADTMRVSPDSSWATAYYKVNIQKGTMITQCDSAMIYDREKRVELFGNPLAKQDNVWMKGNRMVAFYNEKEVTRVDILGNAEIREVPRDSLVLDRDNWVRGDTLTLYLHDNEVDSVRVTGKAESEYHPVNPGRTERNRIAGDRMFLRMGHEQIEWVDVQGRASGTYRYVELEKGQTADSLRAAGDTSLTYVPFATKAQRVDYAASRIQYDAQKQDLFLRGTSQVSYHGSVLTGETITYHADQQILDASGSPTLTEGDQKIYGERMDYDMESETGLVTKGSTQYDQGYYSGENLAKVGKDEMKVWDSYYTTCDLAEPHYHFAAKDMKVYPDDKVFSGPIWLHIGKTPIVALPFMANSISRGRRSGFLRPDIEFGITNDSNRFIRGLGYYWATNDYTDFTFVADYEEDVRWRFYVNNRYAWRYHFNGDANFNFVRDTDGTGAEWTYDQGHSQDLGERSTLNANLRFVSSDEAPQNVNTIDNVNRYIDRSIRSNVSLRKSWQTTALSLSATRAQNLNITDPDAVKVDMTLPDFQLSIPSRNLYFGSDTGPAEGLWQSLLKNTRYSPSVSGSYRRTEKLYETTDLLTGQASLGLSSPQRAGFVTLSPSINAGLVSTRFDQGREAYQDFVYSAADTDTVFVSALDSTRTDSRFTWSAGIAANTNFYGTFYPRIGRLRGIRHALTPSASYGYSPPRNGSPRAQTVNLGLRNSLDLKFAGKDTTETGEEEVRKVSGVVIWSLATNYRPDRNVDEAWGNIGSGLNFNLFGINLSLNHSIDPYELKVLNTSATSGLSIRGRHPFGRSEKVEVRELNQVASSDTTRKDRSGSGMEFVERDEYGQERPRDGKAGESGEFEVKEGMLPWSLNLGLSHSKSSSGSVSSTLRVGWDFQLTDNWRIDYSTIYNVEERQLDGQNFGITRDLHCWEMTFARQELGRGDQAEWQYYFRIALKAHRDLYGESGTRGLGSGLMGQF